MNAIDHDAELVGVVLWAVVYRAALVSVGRCGEYFPGVPIQRSLRCVEVRLVTDLVPQHVVTKDGVRGFGDLQPEVGRVIEGNTEIPLRVDQGRDIREQVQ